VGVTAAARRLRDDLPACARGRAQAGCFCFVFRRFLFVWFPKALFYKKRNQARTANGLIVTGAISLLGRSGLVWLRRHSRRASADPTRLSGSTLPDTFSSSGMDFFMALE